MTGTIKKIIAEKNFGFIKDEAGGEYFFHRDDLAAEWDRIEVGNTVQFRVLESPKGMRAADIRILREG